MRRFLTNDRQQTCFVVVAGLMPPKRPQTVGLPTATQRSGALTGGGRRVMRLMFAVHATARAVPRTVHASKPWRFAAPLRSAGGAARWFALGMWTWITFRPGSRPYRVVRHGVVAVVTFVLGRPRLAQPGKRLLWRLPTVQKRLQMMLLPADAPAMSAHGLAQHKHKNLSDLSPYGRRVYDELDAAVTMRRGNS
jgi:hypothetical protein